MNRSNMKKWLSAALVLCLFTSFTPRPLVWVAIGDSITYLNEHPDEANHRITKGYMTMVTQQLPHIRYINHGYNGWTSGDVAKSIDKLGFQKADIYSVFLGTNDWWRGAETGTLNDYRQGTGPGTVYGSFRIILDKVRSLNPDAKIVLITPLQRGDFVYLNNARNNAHGSWSAKNGRMLSDIVAAIDSIATLEGFALVDLYHRSGITPKNMVRYKRLKNPATGEYRNYAWPAYKAVPFDPDHDAYPYPPDAVDMTYDGLHPSDKGYAVITKMLVKVLKGY
jgi:lysophospholipase L1-like esterase